MSLFKNPIVLGLIAGVLALVVTYGEAKINSKETETNTYVKVFMLVALLVSVASYFMIDKNISMITGGTKLLEKLNSSSASSAPSTTEMIGGAMSSAVGDLDMTDIAEELTAHVLTSAPDW